MKKSTIAIIAILGLGLGLSVSWLMTWSQPIQLEAATWFGEQARKLPDFELIDENGRLMSQDDLRGKWQLLFFGYTHCPDICPASLQTLRDMVQVIDDEHVRDALQVVFISVDPDRDSPDVLKNYVDYFHSDFVAATATKAHLQRLTRSLGITYFIDQTNHYSENYDVAHSSAFILLNPMVAFSGLFTAPHDSRIIARDLIKIIEHS